MPVPMVYFAKVLSVQSCELCEQKEGEQWFLKNLNLSDFNYYYIQITINYEFNLNVFP